MILRIEAAGENGVLEDLEAKEGEAVVDGLLLQLEEQRVVVETRKSAFMATLKRKIILRLPAKNQSVQPARASA